MSSESIVKEAFEDQLVPKSSFDNQATVTRRLRAVMQDAQSEVYRAFSNAGMGVRFVTQLVGRALGDIVNRFVQGRLM